MREQQLAEVAIDRLAAPVAQGQAGVAQGKPLQARDRRRFHRHERAGGRLDGVAEALSHAIAVAGRAGQRIGAAARRKQDVLAGDRAVLGLDRADRAVLRQDLDRARLPPLHAAAPQRALQRLQNVARAVGLRKDAITALDLERAAVFLKKRHRRLRRIAEYAAIEEAPVARHIFQNRLRTARIGHIAASLPGDEQLFAVAVVFLQQQHAQPLFRRRRRRHQSGRAAADDHQIIRQLFHTHDTCPRFPPAGRRSRPSRCAVSTQRPQ